MHQEDIITLSKIDYEQLLTNHKELQFDNARLREELSYLKRMLYGSKSERYISTSASSIQEQLSLFDAPDETDAAPLETESISYNRIKKKEPQPHPGRSELPAHLPRIRKVLEPQEDVGDMVHIRDDITEELEYTPPKLFVKEYVRPIYAPKNGNGPVIQADLPNRPIEKGRPGPGLLAHLICSKCVDYLPLYRQQQQFKRLGVDIPLSTLDSWYANALWHFDSIYDLLIKKITSSDYIQADETPLKVLQEQKTKKGKAHLGYLWPYFDPVKKVVVFDYRHSRNKSGPMEFLKDFKGILQTDGWDAYPPVVKKYKLTHVECHAHARRYFEKALANDKQRAAQALNYFQKLFAIEREAKDNNCDHEQRKILRQQKSIPILDALKQWCLHQLDDKTLTPKSSIAKAIRYTLKRWEKLTTYTQYGNVEISNNLIENCIRPVALGRKNFLFAGAKSGAIRLAKIYSIISTCKLHKIDPFVYFKTLLTILPDDFPYKNIDQIVPWNFIKYCEVNKLDTSYNKTSKDM